MEELRILKTRRSIREYADKEIGKEELEKIVEAARFAASARNIQPWEFVIITDSALLKKFAELAENGRFLAQAKASIAVFCADTKYYLEDGCAATCNIMLAASALGIGSCWIAGDKKPYCIEVSKLLGAPAGYKLVSLVSLGYPKEKGAFYPAEKKALKEMLHWEKF